MKFKKVFYKYCFLIFTVIFLSACGGVDGGDGVDSVNRVGTGLAGNSANIGQTISTVLQGSVGDGPIIGAKISVYSRSGRLLATHVSDERASYEMTVRTINDDFPLTVQSTGGLDIVTMTEPDFKLTSYVQRPGDFNITNINPFSTMIHESAKSMPGGLTRDNIRRSKRYVLNQFNFGYDSKLMPDPVTSIVNRENIAMIIRSSEAMGEMVRRTRNKMRTRDSGITGDYVIRALASDLRDGFIDGAGGNNTDNRLAAVANVTASQVILETMRGELKVNNSDATLLMNNAIYISLPNQEVSTSVNDISINAEMIEQAVTNINTVSTVAKNPSIDAILESLNNITPGTQPEEAANNIADNIMNDLELLLDNTTTASNAKIDLINEAIQEESGPVIPAPVNTAPIISGAPASSIQQGNTYSFAPNAFDQDGDSLTFSITNNPSWISFDPDTGSLRGTPDASDIGTYSEIGLSVFDGKDSVSLTSFSITVVDAPNEAPITNETPTINGNPSTVAKADSQYNFSPAASDPENEILSFSIRNQPVWASFNPSTGTLMGNPGSANTGITTGIVISVSDGSNTTSLPAFDIIVTSSVVTYGSATLSWTPPTANTDGSTLSNLAGYKIYYGTTQGNYTNVVNLNNPGLTSYFLDNLPSGHTYYFVMTAYDSNGNESGYSPDQSKAIP